ncbi:hypothetical protein VaNZ11_004685 [Volvox africanus]|uniref:U3 small nucleolar RNA-associated protein 11 n=1 Tax=Volvox africanus TaxID=51714 RepID=A0ABQ5RWU2_9CHLO|nr:hypothetical protein VaNZ11_004685 [Volvox africanus]
MTALANAIKRKSHKERSQPAARQKYGLLEKHKDYVERARNFHKKDKVLKALKRKAEERNPDEFYFAMEKARTKEGVHDGRHKQANKYSHEELLLMRTQDVKYLSMKATTEANKAARLRESLHFIGATVAKGDKGSTAVPRHTVFVDNEEEAARFDAAEYFDTPVELLDRTFNRPRSTQLADRQAVLGITKKLDKRNLPAYKELAQRQVRQRKVAAVANRLAYGKLLMGKGQKRKLRAKELKKAGVEPVAAGKVFVWKRERQR